jgi:RNA polymerase primary sigma factor
LLASYLREIDETPLLTAAEEQDLGRRVQQGDRAARDQLARANLRLVVKLAREYAGRGLELPDLVAEGNLGLLRAVDLFDPARNTRFGTYACYWIRQSIRQALARIPRPVRIPVHMVVLLARWHRARTTLQSQLHRPPTPEEVVSQLDLSPRRRAALDKALCASRQGTFLLGRADSEEPVADRLMDRAARPPDTVLAEAEDQSRVRLLLDTLDPREAAVLRLRFGFHDEKPCTLREIGKQLGLTRERVRQLQVQALRTLEERLRNDGAVP